MNSQSVSNFLPANLFDSIHPSREELVVTQALMERSKQELSQELSEIQEQVEKAFLTLLRKPVENRGPFKVPFLEQQQTTSD